MKRVKITVNSFSQEKEGVNKIPRKKAEVIVKYIYRLLKNKAKRFEVVGSYRRGKKILGDLEFLASKDLSTNKILKTLEKSKLIEIEEVLRHGSQILSLIVTYAGKKVKAPFIKMEFYISPIQSWGAALLMWTGPASFNIYMRSKALFKKWKLNEKGLFDARGKRIAGKTEKEIFEKLGIPYMTPEEREKRFK